MSSPDQFATPKMEIVYRPLDWFKAYERNPRKNDGAVDRMCASIKQFGFAVPMLCRSSGEIVDGHLRFKGSRKLEMGELPVILCDHWSEAQVKAFRLMVNRSVAWAEWDMDLLGPELLDLKAMEFDLNLTGFDSRELDTLLAAKDDEAANAAPSLPAAVAVSQPGDLWLLGQHRLLVGDATNPDDLDKVCGEIPIDAMWTDPPYGVKYVGKTKEALTIKNDEAGSVEALMVDALAAVGPHLVAGAPFYIAHPAGPVASAFIRAVEMIGWRIHQGLVWCKDSMVLGHSDYHYQHEPILYGFTPGSGRPGRGKHEGSHWYGDNSQVSVFNIPRPKRSTEHPTMKPVELIQRCIGNSAPRGGTVIDLFMGSGSTLIAAEVLDRRAVGTEIDPKYVDVIVMRWQDFTQKKATLEGDGRSFEEVAAERTLEVAVA